MRSTALAGAWLIVAAGVVAAAGEPVSFSSPGFAPTQVDAAGRLIEDWATVGVKLSGEGVADGPPVVEAVKLDGVIPAARAVSNRGAVRVTATAYRAPAYNTGYQPVRPTSYNGVNSPFYN